MPDNDASAAHDATPTVHFHALGILDLRGAQRVEVRAVLVQPKRLSLFAYLVLARPSGFHRRDELFALFWPDAGIEQARRSLRQSLHFLRQSLGSVIESRGDDEVSIQRGALWCDVHEFTKAIDRGQLAEALAMYRGDLLTGLHVAGLAPEFDIWLENERARLRSLAVWAASSLRDTSERSGNLALAVQYAREAHRLNPVSEVPLRHLIVLLDQMGDRAAALRAYDSFVERLASELETQPSPETQAAVAGLRRKGVDSLAVPEPVSGLAVAPVMDRPNDAALPPTIQGRRRAIPGRLRRTLVGAGIAALVLLLVGRIVSMRSGPGGDVAPMRRQLTFSGNVSLSAISPDGRSMAYVTGNAFDEQPQDTVQLYVQDVSGGTALEIAKMESIRSLSWSLDGTGVVVSGRRQGVDGVYSVPRLGGTPLRVASGTSSVISADGSRIATWDVRSRNRIRISHVRNGDTSSLLIPGPVRSVLGMAWSPLGELLAVRASSGTEQGSLWTLSAQRRDSALVLPPDVGNVGSWIWSAAGDAIYYVVNDQLWRAPVAARTGRRSGPPKLLLSDTPVSDAYAGRNHVSVTANGDRLAYTRFEGHANIWLDEAGAKSGPRQLTRGTERKWCPSVSPDQRRAAYLVRGGDATTDIHVVDLSTGVTERLTRVGSVEDCPAWSPTGSMLAFLMSAGGERRLATVEATGSSAPRILSSLNVGAGIIAWSPDGRIAHHVPDGRNFTLFDPETGREEKLIPNDSAGFIFNPWFAPDGRQVVVSWNRPDQRGFWLVSLVDGSQRPLDGFAASDFVVGWAKDGESLFVERESGTINRVSVHDGSSTVVARAIPASSGCRPIERPGGLALACMINELTSDVWIVDRFDPSVRVAGR